MQVRRLINRSFFAVLTFPSSSHLSVAPPFTELCATIYAISTATNVVGLFLWSNSLRAICTWPTVLSFCQISHHPAIAEARLFGVQHSHVSTRPMEVSIHGPTPNGNW